MTDFHRFPHTPHLAWLGSGEPRDDKLLSPGEAAEPHAGQFARLPAWLAPHGDAMAEALLEHADGGLMLFGEWGAARHSLAYTRLPDWLLRFDVFDSGIGRFWSSTRRNARARRQGLATTPQLARGRFSLAPLPSLLATQGSRFRDGPLEGVVIRYESADWCEQRAKLVRSDFTQTITDHWRSRRIEWKRLDAGASAGAVRRQHSPRCATAFRRLPTVSQP